MNDDGFDVGSISDDEFAKAMRQLGRELDDGKPIPQHESLAKPEDDRVPAGPRRNVNEMHWMHDAVNITQDQRMTFGKYGGVAFVDIFGSVAASQVVRIPRCFCGREHEMDQADSLGLLMVVNGERVIIPFKVLSAMMVRAQNHLQGGTDIDPKEETWDL